VSSALAVSTSPCPVSSLSGCQPGCSLPRVRRQDCPLPSRITRLLKRRLLRLADSLHYPTTLPVNRRTTHIDSLYSTLLLPCLLLPYSTPKKITLFQPKSLLRLPEYTPSRRR
ncbi:hypothetical protein COCVIDRAFT_87025, partial [Bipolaris victoriae FI3]